MNRVVGLESVGVEIPQLADVVGIGIGEENELWLVGCARRVSQAAMPVEKSSEHFGGPTGVGCSSTG